MKKRTIFFLYFETSNLFLHVYKILWSSNLKNRNAISFNMWTKSCLLQQVWTIFSAKIMKRPNNFMADFQSSYRYVHTRKFFVMWKFFKKIWQPFQNLLNYFLTFFPKNLMKKPVVYLTDNKRSHKVLLCCKNLKSRNFWQASNDGL